MKKNTTTKIFVVEDDPMFQRMARHILELNPDHEVHIFETGQTCIQQLHLNPDIITLDYTLPDMTGEEVLKKIKEYNCDISVVILSGQKNVSTAVQLLREGAFNYISKDAETKEQLLHTISNIKREQQLIGELNSLKTELQTNFSFQKNIIGQSQSMRSVFTMLEKAVRTNITISITGETGTGKEVIAKAIHYNSERKKESFVAINMSAIPKELLESELFGYEKGAFTGANTRKKGLFELADKGTLFLDEIGEMDINIQAKVLRVLQEREFRRVGGEQLVKFDVRIIVATHRDLLKEVSAGTFREDLYYRIMGLPISLPPLRERNNDILLLANHFLAEFTKSNKLEKMDISRSAKEKLLSHSYPGNVRELKAIIDLAAVLANDHQIKDTDIQIRKSNKEPHFLATEKTFEAYKKQIINHYLEKYNNDISLVSKKLDIGKSTIYRMLKSSKEMPKETGMMN